MDQNDNTNKELQPQELPAVEVKENFGSSSETTNDFLKAGDDTPTPPVQSTNIEHKPETMEVHKHPHHVLHKKKWPEYLLEFFMLFLAVFLGFVAENYREHTVEKDRAKQYASQLLNDLKTDSAQLDSSILLNAMISRKLDTLRRFIDQNSNTTTGQLYYYGRFTTWYNRLTPNDATMQQMKASGGIRYFHNPRIENMISEYDRLLRRLQVHEAGEYNSLTEMWLLTGQIYRGDVLDSLNDLEKPPEYYARFMQKDYPLVSADPILLERLSNLCRARQLWIRYKIDENLKPALKSATELMEQLKKELN